MRIMIVTLVLAACLSVFSGCGKADKNEYGRVGRDTVEVIGNGKYKIAHVADATSLIMSYEDVGQITLIKNVVDYKSNDGVFYVYGEEGYGVINIENNTSKIYITDEAYLTEREKYFYKDEYTEYVAELSDFLDFSTAERKILSELEEKNRGCAEAA
ncbi:MAG: hypothetical protein LUC92_01550 [Clostridiales bacterium]|nr:hypothetical protein [Clostridiales bacterium]